MPIVKRKAISPLPLADSLETAKKDGQNPSVFFLAATGEVFLDYDYYHQRIFQCELSGKSSLTYFEAAHSEEQQTLAIQRQFPDPLKVPVLNAVQFQITGRLDNLVDLVVERFKNRFFAEETVFVEIDGARHHGTILNVALCTAKKDPEATAQIPHFLGANLAVSMEEAARLDDPGQYLYTVALADGKASSTEANAEQLSRDRMLFSKSIVRKFLRDTMERDSQIGSAWYVRESLAKRYGILTTPSEEVLRMHEDIKEGKLSKRRKLADNDATIARRKAREDRKAKSADDQKRLDAKKLLKFPAEDLLLEPVTEKELHADTCGELPKRAQRPVLDGAEFLGVPLDTFEPFLMAYYFFLTLGTPLHISTIAYDDFDAALRHPTHEPACFLLNEMHGVLLNAIVRDGAHSRDLAPGIQAKKRRVEAPAPIIAAPEEPQPMNDSSSDISDPDEEDLPEKTVLDAAISMGRGWEKRILHADNLRAGWESAMAGCLAQRATPETLPRFYAILSYLTGVEHDDALQDGRCMALKCKTIEERYAHMPLEDKIQALLFLCQLVVVTKNVKTYYEECENHLTELRKERMEIIRARKRTLEQRHELDGIKKEHFEDQSENQPEEQLEEHPEEQFMQVDEKPVFSDDDTDSDSDSERDELAEEDELEDSEDSDAGSETNSETGSEHYKRAFGTRQESLREKAIQRDAEQSRQAQELARVRALQRETKQLNAERRRMDEEALRLGKHEQVIEREFRRYAMIPRLRPLGRDRFMSRYFWLDGIGTASLSTHGGNTAYQTGRVFVQSASNREWQNLSLNYEGGEPALAKRRAIEQGDENVSFGQWGVYTKPEQIEELIAWLRTKGTRENALKAQLLKYRDYIEGGMRKRIDDIALGWREPVETRRSSRVRTEQSAHMRLPYMTWRNTYH
ncbi:hypothetical protein MVES_000771 [Malassezia vespertilionis]|uniref:Uncharacterized protein n=1 Tax=Malassezia vespertilionis TaxID=2020962 RepID=A0A2N1JEX9_9BASI|nr:hypothetical protein MVES_000771 [Malassezia vespertilionis]